MASDTILLTGTAMTLDRKFDPFSDSATLPCREVFTSRVIDAPLTRVYQAFSDPHQLAQWWGPKGFSCTFQEFDLRPGGKWQYILRSPDGLNHNTECMFLDVMPETLVIIRHELNPQFQLSITFENQGRQTIVCSSHVFNSLAEYQQAGSFAFRSDEERLERLASFLKG